MEGIDMSSVGFWLTIVCGSIIFAILSAVVTYQTATSEETKFNKKALIRDTLLGGIFTAIAWILIPDSMKSISEKVTSQTASIQTGLMSGGSLSAPTSVSSGNLDVELQVGPAPF